MCSDAIRCITVASYAFPHFTIHLPTKRNVQLHKAYYPICILATACNTEQVSYPLQIRPPCEPLDQRTSWFLYSSIFPWLCKGCHIYGFQRRSCLGRELTIIRLSQVYGRTTLTLAVTNIIVTPPPRCSYYPLFCAHVPGPIRFLES